MTLVGTPKRILVIGSGAREHALAWRLRQDQGVDEITVAPGNPGMRDVAAIRPELQFGDPLQVARLAQDLDTDLVVVGPEGALAAGIADMLRTDGIQVFGPGRRASRLESSKSFCREIAEAAGIPMADGSGHDDPATALRAARALGDRVVVKADGLAAGKGVTVCESREAAEAAIHAALVERVFGEAGSRVVVERTLDGAEASVIAICDATHVLAVPAARDHKRLSDGDLGPNTGGMGAYSPLPDLSDQQLERIVETFHRPVLAELARRGIPFRGALFAGLMLTRDGPRLLEFNVRFGDPETQAQLPRVGGPLAALLAAAACDRLAETAVAVGIRGSVVPVSEERTVAVVLAAPGYPGRPVSGDAISGMEEARSAGGLVFCAGVSASPDARPPAAGGLLTAGGRVLTVVGRGSNLADAAEHAYSAADRITFHGRQLRRDIGSAPAAARDLVGSAR